MQRISLCHLCAVFFCLLSVPGCDDGFYDVPDVKPPVVLNPDPMPALGLTSQIRAGNAPNQYSVILKWQGNYQSGSWVIRRGEEKGKPTVLEALPPGCGGFEDKAPTVGTRYRYELGSNNRDGFYRISDIIVEVPKDLLVKGRLQFTESGPYQRAFFTDNAVLEMNGTPLKLEASEIISQSGTIETFPEWKKSPSGVSGQTPGNIEIQAKKGTGRLVISARGEMGGDGTDGRSGVTGGVGAAGTPGDWGMNPDLYKHFSKKYIEWLERSMRVRPLPPNDLEWTNTIGFMPRYVCARPPSTGGRGAKGTDASDGQNGGNGGDSGRVTVNIATGDILVSVHSQPGTWGRGGRTGKGGDGGDGGPPGRLDDGHRCQPAGTGERGSAGLDGRPGRQGERGAVSPFCVRIGLTTTGDCAKFNLSKVTNQ